MEHREITESYMLTTARDEAGICGKRLILRMVEYANKAGAIEGMKFRPLSEGFRPSNLTENQVNEWGVREIEIPLQDVMEPGAKNYTTAKKAIVSLQQAIMSYSPVRGEWFSFPFLGRVSVKKKVIHAEVAPELWELLVNFSKGFRTYAIDVALGLKSTYSLQLYKYLSRQTDPNALTMSIQDCKTMLGVEKKYRDTTAFIKKCIEPAKGELDAVSPWTFDYELLRSRKGATGRPSINAIRFIPRHQLDKESVRSAAEAVAPVLAGYYSKQSKSILLHKLGFETAQNLGKYTNLFAKASKVMDVDAFIIDRALELDKRRGTENHVENPAGWFIHCLQESIEKA